MQKNLLVFLEDNFLKIYSHTDYLDKSVQDIAFKLSKEKEKAHRLKNILQVITENK